MKISDRAKRSASIVAISFILMSAQAVASTDNTNIIDGAESGGAIIYSGDSASVGNSSETTIFTNFFTEGGAGSGGGAGLGGVFFVDSGANLTLNNVQFIGNTIKGGEGGSVGTASLSNIIINFSSLTVDANPVTALSVTPEITYGPDGVFITGATLSGANSLIANGASVSFGGLSNTGTISEINGTAVKFSNSIAVDASAIQSATVVAPASGATTIQINPTLSASAVQPGMLVYGDGIQAGTTITSVVMDANNNVTSVTLSNATTAAVANLNILSVNAFDANRYQAAGSNSIKPLGALPGLMVGMTVSGDGIPAGTTITAIASDGTVTFSNDVNATAGFTASSQGARVGSDVISLAAARNDLAVGMEVSGDGIAAGTTVVAINGNQITLSNAITSEAAEAISNNSFVASFNKVLSTSSSSLTLSAVDGLRVGALLIGDNVPENAVITGINPLTKTVTYAIDPDAAALNKGGAMNGLISTGTIGSDGKNGKNGSMYNAILHDGEGSPGTNGYDAGEGSGAAGGNGGNGGNGSAGLPYNADAILGLSSAIWGATDATMETAADWSDFNFASALVKTANLVHAWADVGIATADLVKWNVDLANGTVGLGGDGGSGGEGGEGDTFFGGGAGGAGGKGGSGAISITDGGAGGDGGTGGKGGFGAGGGAGGSGGDGGENGAAADGNAGDGGKGGFGAGDGSNGDGLYGGGGSGFGGAIFVRAGGTLTITGNALFQNNSVLAGSSNNGGEAGEAAGTDLFMMRGSTVTLSPGAGNLIRFEGSIADDSKSSYDASYASGAGASLQVTGGGLVQFAGVNTYSGKTHIGGGTLEAEDGEGIDANSHINFNGVSSIGNGLSQSNAGVWLTSGTVIRRVGSLPHQLSWSGSGGFAAGDDGLTLNFGAINGNNGQTLNWGTGSFVQADSTLVFGSEYGTGAIKLVNAVNLNANTGQIAVFDNAASDGDYVHLAGRFTNGSLLLNDSDYAGTAYFTAQNSLTSLTLNNGLVSTRLGELTGRLFDSANGGALIVNGGRVELYSAETLTDLEVRSAGSLVTFTELTAGSVTNSGLIVHSGAVALDSLHNLEGGQIAYYGALTSDAIDNAGTLIIGGEATTGNISNLASGQVMMLGKLVATGTAHNSGLWYLANDLDAGAVVQDGFLTVVGTELDGAETAATRTITTVAFSGAADSIVHLGGASGTVANTLIISQSGDSAYAGQITGPGSLTKAGNGTLTLTGNNDFTGPLTIQSGGIDTTGGGTLGDTVAVRVAQGGAFTLGTDDTIGSLDNAGTVNLTAASTIGNLVNHGFLANSGAFSVTGGFANASTGTVTFGSGSSNNFGSLSNDGAISAASAITVKGDYVQNGGSLTTTAALTTGSLSGTGGAIVLGDATVFTINQTSDGNYAGSISGANASVVKAGAGTLTLSGAAGSFAPATLNVTAGVVAVDGAGILDSALQVNVMTGAGLALIRGDQTINNLTGTGTLALNGNNLYLANGGNFSGTVTGDGNVQVTTGSFDLVNTVDSTNGNFSVLSGSKLNVVSTGQLNAPLVNVEGNLNVAGQVKTPTLNVDGGLLHLGSGSDGGTVLSDILHVNKGGALTGFGAVGGQTLVGGDSPGTLSPGNSPGIISFADLTLASYSVSRMEIEGASGAGLAATDGGYDLVRVTGAFSIQLDSTLEIANSNSFELALGQAIRIFEFTPGSVSGYFGTVTSDFDQAVAYNVATGSVIGLGDHSAASFASAIARTPNEQAILRQIRVNSTGGVDQFYGGRLVERAAAALANGNADTVSEVFAKASPESYASLVEHVKFSMLDNLTDLGGHEIADTPRFFMTGSVSASSAKNEKEAGYLRFKTRDSRFNLGVGADLPVARIQFAYGRSDGRVSSDLMRSDAKGDQFSLGASVPVALSGKLRLLARAAYGDYSLDGTRTTNDGTARFRSVNGKSTVYGGGVEYYRASTALSLTLSAELLRVENTVNGFTESGVSALDALAVNKQRDNFNLIKTRVEAGYAITPNIQGFLDVALDHDIDRDPQNVSAHLVTEDVVMTVGSSAITDTRFRVGAGTRVNLGNNIIWSLQGYAGNASRYGGRTEVRFNF